MNVPQRRARGDIAHAGCLASAGHHDQRIEGDTSELSMTQDVFERACRGDSFDDIKQRVAFNRQDAD